MYQPDAIDRECQAEWQHLQAVNATAYHETETYQDGNDRPSNQKQVKKKLEMYDRIEIQWATFAEIAFVLTTFSSTCATVCFLRVFGAGLLAGSVALIAVLGGVIVLLCFWRELSASDYKIRVLFCLFALTCGLALSLSDQAVDLTRHYWAVLQAAVILGGVTSLAFGALVMAIKLNTEKEN